MTKLTLSVNSYVSDTFITEYFVARTFILYQIDANIFKINLIMQSVDCVLCCEGKHGLPLSAVVRFVKWAYCYEQWEFFDFWLPRSMAAAEVG